MSREEYDGRELTERALTHGIQATTTVTCQCREELEWFAKAESHTNEIGEEEEPEHVP